MWGFVHGIRFDLSTALMFNAPLLLIWLAPTLKLEKPFWRISERVLFALMNTLALGMNIVDCEFFKFEGKRLSFEIFSIQQDLNEQAWSLISSYWYLALLVVVLFVILYYLATPFPGRSEKRNSALHWLWRVALVGLCVLGIRGGFQLKPLHPMHAYVSGYPELAALTLDSGFTLIKSRDVDVKDLKFYYKDHHKAVEDLLAYRPQLKAVNGEFKDWNVVVLILESFSAQYTGRANKDHKGYTPFLDELASKSYYFQNNYANGRRSIVAVPSILCALPGLMSTPIITSDFSDNEIHCVPSVLNKHGYKTMFFHGAHNGSMHFDTFSEHAGFQKFFGLNEFPHKPGDVDPYWGALDEPFLQFAVKKLNTVRQPFFMTLFTLSSHHPYYIPPKYRGRFPKGTLPIHESVGYTDYSLKRFFESASKTKWFNKTIFILTGDHIQKSDRVEYNTPRGDFRVPLIVYIPGPHPKLDFNPSRYTQHADISKTIYDLLGIRPKRSVPFGTSVFSDQPGHAYNFDDYGHWFSDNKYYVYMDINGKNLDVETVVDELKTKPLPKEQWTDPEVVKRINYLKAVIDVYDYGFLTNKLYDWRTW